MLLAQKNVQLHLHFKRPSSFCRRSRDRSNPSLLCASAKRFEMFTDTQTSILSGIPESAMCVQRFDDSLNSAIHITYRVSLRSSSMCEPRDPLLKVLFVIIRLHLLHKLFVKRSDNPRAGAQESSYSAQVLWM